MSNSCRRSSLSTKYLESKTTIPYSDVTNAHDDVTNSDCPDEVAKKFKVTYDVVIEPSSDQLCTPEPDETLAILDSLHDKHGRKWETSLEDIGTCSSSSSTGSSASSTVSVYDDGDDENESDGRSGVGDNGFGSNTESQIDPDFGDDDFSLTTIDRDPNNDSANESLTPTFEEKAVEAHRRYKFSAAQFANQLIDGDTPTCAIKNISENFCSENSFNQNECQRNYQNLTHAKMNIYRNEVHISNISLLQNDQRNEWSDDLYASTPPNQSSNNQSSSIQNSSIQSGSSQPKSLGNSHSNSFECAKDPKRKSFSQIDYEEYEAMMADEGGTNCEKFSVSRNFIISPNADREQGGMTKSEFFVSSLQLNSLSGPSGLEESFVDSCTDSFSCFSTNDSSNQESNQDSNQESEESSVRRDIKSPGIKNDKTKKNCARPRSPISNCAKIKSKVKRRQRAAINTPPSGKPGVGGELEIERVRIEPGRNEAETKKKEKVEEVTKDRVLVLRKEILSKNSEIKELKLKLKIEKDKIKDLLRLIEKGQQIRPGLEQISTSELRHLRRELSSLRQERENLRKQLLKKKEDEKKKELLLRSTLLKEEKKNRGIEEEMKREVSKNTRLISDLEKSLKEQKRELEDKQKTIHKLECEKLYLGEEIYRITGFEEGFWSDATVQKPLLTPKEKCLVQRNSSLSTEVSLLQRQCKSLAQDNSSLKRRMEVEMDRPVERGEKERERQKELVKLKRKNQELSTMTRKLEEKVKSLEKKTKDSPTTERRTQMVAKQREKEATYEKQLEERDKEIQKLKQRMRELVRKLTGKNGEINRAQTTLELEHIIRMVTKERLQLERHLAVTNEGLSRAGGVESEPGTYLASFRETKSTLRQQLGDLDILTRQHKTLEKHVREKDLECVTLKEKLKLKNELCQDLEFQLAKVIEKNTELTIQNSDLQKQIQELQHVNVSEECRNLKRTLGRGPHDWPPTSVDQSVLHTVPATLESSIRLDNVYGLADGPNRARGDTNLEHVLIQMKEAADRRRELEKQHAEALSQLREKQAALEGALGIHGTPADRKAYSETIEALQSKIRELEKKAEVQNLRHEELLLEMQSMKKTQQGSPKNSWSRSGSLSAELQSPESGEITPAGMTSYNSLSSGVYTATTASSLFTSGMQGMSHPTHSTAVNSEIDRIMAKIEQDNRILAELDKTRTSLGITTCSSSSCTTSSGLTSTFPDRAFTHFSSSRSFAPIKSMGVSSSSFSVPRTSTATTMAALDLSHSSFTNPFPDSFIDHNLSHLNLGLPLSGSSTFSGVSPGGLAGGGSLFSNTMGTSPGVFGNLGLDVGGLNLLGQTTENLLGGGNPIGATNYPSGSSLPTIITTLYDKDDTNLVNGNLPGLGMPSDQMDTDNRVLDVLEIPGKGRCHVYIARYSYDPFQQSPNENPEAELALNAGDYVLVWGQMDEVSPRTIDGFFDGELLDGRRGLVPSNFVEKLVGDDLIEFHQSIVIGLRDCDESVSTSVPQDLDFICQDDTQLLLELGLNPARGSSIASYLDLEDIMEEDEEPLGEQDLFFSVLVPPPVQLTLERQLNKSILIGWNPPPDTPPGTIESYHVYVDGLLKTTVKASERTRALVEGVDSTKLHRISVRSVTPNRRTSRDAACTMVIGKDCPISPTSVRATNITSTSSVISWMPSNSNFQHTVCVNSVEVRTVKPGVYRHTITGLSPNTTYRASIKAKNLRAPQFDEKSAHSVERLSAIIEFRTLPKGWRGLPDPPVDVQVEMGPQDGSLLVTWLPVTLNNSSGTSNGVLVTGYAVYADGKKVTEVDSPTGDHALIDLTKIHGFEPKQITVRTKSRECVSTDSVPTLIPSHFTRSRTKGGKDFDIHSNQNPSNRQVGPLDQNAQAQTGAPRSIRERLLGRRSQPIPGGRTDHMGQTVLEHEDNLSDKEIYPGHFQGGHGPQHQNPIHHPQQQLPQQQQSQYQQNQQQYQQPGQTSISSIGPAKSGLAKLSNSLFSTLGFGGKGTTPNTAPRTRQITKEPPGIEPHFEGYLPEDDYEGGRGRYDPRHPPQRGRPPPMAHPHRQPIPRDPRDPRDYRDPHMPPHPRDPRDRRDIRDPRDPRDRYDDRHRPEFRDREGRGRGGEHPRIFVALFDYDPPTMSPNPDACDEELGFREGQLIKVYGDKDSDGFYWGEASGRNGYVPCNMVSEVDDDRVAQELLKESESGRRRRDGSLGRRAHAGDRWGDIYANMPVRKMVAMYDYDPQELSPNVDSEVELSFQTGDIIYVYGDMDDDGFYMGELRGQRGLVPSNFLQDAPHDYDEHRSRRDTLDPRDRPPPTVGGRGHGPGVHGPPPPPRPDQRDKRKDPRPVASRSVANNAQDMRGRSLDNPVGPRQDPAGSCSSAQERSGRSVSRDRDRSGTRASSNPLMAGPPGKRYDMDLLDEDVDQGPIISSADLDQLMEDFDLNDPMMEADMGMGGKSRTTTTTTPTTSTTTSAPHTDSKLGGLAGGLSAGLSSLNPMGKLGDLAKENPVTDVMSMGKNFLFKKFGL